MIVQLVEEALTDLGLHMDRQKLMLTLQNIGGETLTQEQFRMVIASQHIMDENTAKNLMNKASESRKLEQRARAKLLHIKGNEQRIRVIEVELHYSSLNAGDVFMLDGWNALWLWKGRESSSVEVDAARGLMQNTVAERKRVLTMPALTEEEQQGEESEEFWDLIGGEGPVASADQAGDDDMIERLPDPFPPIPERSKVKPRAAIVGAGVAGNWNRFSGMY